MTTREDFLTAIGQLVQGEIPLDEADKILAIDMAARTYSKHRPRVVVEDETGAGTFDYAITALAAWSDGFSVIKQIEFPVDDTDETADVLDDDEWQVYSKPAGDYIRFLEDTPAATESFRVTYTAPHSITDAASTVKAADNEAVQALAAAIFCEMLATYFAQNQDSTISADSVDHKSKAAEYTARARVYRKMYFDHMGIKEGERIAASITTDLDPQRSWGTDGVTHRDKSR
jgi:hypothetical protein